ncbi:MAG: hypothetical protein JWL90_368 [Chthoniobacteraceae bacterium]|nr:hypothetical protein [Chthoniobacteraceae bacterium]
MRDGGAHLSYPALEDIFCEGVRFVVGKVFADVIGAWQPWRRLVLRIARWTDTPHKAIERDRNFKRGRIILRLGSGTDFGLAFAFSAGFNDLANEHGT